MNAFNTDDGSAVANAGSMTTVGVRKLRKHGASGRWRAYIVNEDAHGLWLFSPAGSLYRGTNGDWSAECEVGQGARPAGSPVLSLIPPQGWWFATWTWLDQRQHSWISVDICTPPRLISGEWTYEDLELDPMQAADGRSGSKTRMNSSTPAGIITPTEQAAAREASDSIAALMRTATDPLGQAGWQHLASAITMDLPPLTTID
jgi:hypothetical protein